MKIISRLRRFVGVFLNTSDLRKLLLTSFLCITVLGAAGLTAAAAPRTSQRLDDGWTLYPRHDVNKQPARIEVQVPHTWNTEDVFNGMGGYLRSAFVYERNLPLPKADGQRRFLHFQAVNSVADVFINGRRVGSHYGGYTAFCFEITDFLQEGDNRLEVNVSNAYRQDVAPLAGDFNIYGGITRPVTLITTDADCISPLDHASSGLYVHQESVSRERAELTVETVLSVKRRDLQAEAVLLDAAGREVLRAAAPAEGERVRIPLTLDRPHLWDGRRDPYLYTVRVELKDGSRVVDSVSETTGLRSFRVDPEQGFFLNGEHVDLHGVCRHEEAEGTASLLNEEMLRRDARLIYDMGATGVRFVHYPHSRYDVGQYDSLGIVVWYELNLAGPGGYGSPGYVADPALERNTMANLEEMILQNYNSPAICFWSLCNELSFKFDAPDRFLRELHLRAKALDPQRLTTLAICYDQDRFQHITDIIGWNKYFGWYGSDGKGIGAFMDNAHALAGFQPIGLCEYGASASILHHSFQESRNNYVHFEEYQCKVHEYNWEEMASRPYVWCKFIWQWADTPSSIRDEGDRRGMNDKGVVTYDRKTCKDAYYFYQANWSEAPMLYIAHRRYTLRSQGVTDVKVYSNQKQAVLYLNGRKVATGRNDGLGRIVFAGVRLQEGDNMVRVVSGALTDECVWNLDSSRTEEQVTASERLDGAVD